MRWVVGRMGERIRTIWLWAVLREWAGGWMDLMHLQVGQKCMRQGCRHVGFLI